MRICGNCNVRKEKEINNGEQYITLDIYLQLDCLENLEVTSSISSYYVGKSGKGLTTYLTLTTIMSSNKKQEARTDNTDVVNQYLIKLLEDFKYSPYTRYRKRKVKNEPTGADLFLGKQISQLLKKKKHIILCSKIIKHGAVNKKHFNKLLGMELHQWTRETWNLPRKCVRAIVKQTKKKRIWVCMKTRTIKSKKMWMHVTMKLWMNVMTLLLFMNTTKNIPINVQTSVHIIKFCQEIICAVWKQISWPVTKSYTVRTGASYLETHI